MSRVGGSNSLGHPSTPEPSAKIFISALECAIAAYEIWCEKGPRGRKTKWQVAPLQDKTSTGDPTSNRFHPPCLAHQGKNDPSKAPRDPLTAVAGYPWGQVLCCSDAASRHKWSARSEALRLPSKNKTFPGFPLLPQLGTRTMVGATPGEVGRHKRAA